jgi:hypothetical protein
MDYRLMQNGLGVQRMADGAFIPSDPANSDWQTFLVWLAQGNRPDPPPIPLFEDALFTASTWLF